MRPRGLDKRRFPRVRRRPPPPGRDAASQVALLDLSPGGTCLWFRDLPSIKRLRTLRLSWEGQEWILPVRPVWISECIARPEENVPLVLQGWRVGLAFTGTGPGSLLGEPLPDDLSDARVEVDAHGY